jgi:hypothetical protein
MLALAASFLPAPPGLAAQTENEAAFAQLPAFASGGGRSVGEGRSELAGLIVNGREQPEGIVLVRRPDGRRLAPLHALARALALKLSETPSGPWLLTPLGPARLEERELERLGGERFVEIALLAERLAARIVFDEGEFALRVDLPWEVAAAAGASPADPVRPDVGPGRFSIAGLRGEVAGEWVDGSRATSGFMAVRGGLGPGSYHARLERDSAGRERLRDWQWSYRDGRRGLLAGHQFLAIHPLLSGMEFTGVQAAYVERAPDLLAPADPLRLLDDGRAAVQNIRGEGPPGGIAELRLDGRPIARQRIPLDGRFEFLDVRLPPGYVRIEVLLYAPFADGAPAAVLDLSGTASPRLLPEGAWLAHGGAGVEGNPFDPILDTGEEAFFLRGRRAFGGRITLEGALLARSGREEVALGAVAGLGPLGLGGLTLARAGGASAWMATLEGERERWFWRGFARAEEAGFAPSRGEAFERFAELGLRSWPRFELSLIGREREGYGGDVRFLKPALRYSSGFGLSLSSRPDFLGEYVHDLYWAVGPRTRLYARRDVFSNQLGGEHRLGPAWLIAGSVQEERESGRERLSLSASYQDPGDPFGWYADVALLVGSGTTGWLLRAGRELWPGLRFRAEALRDPLWQRHGEGAPQRVGLALSWDFGLSGGRLVRAGSGVSAGRGSLAVIIEPPAGAPSLAGVAVRIDGQARGRSDAAGRMQIADLPAGVYRVELDEEALPLELSAVDRGFWAEIGAGQVTELRFRVAFRLGIIGRLRGTAAVGQVLVLDQEGRVRGQAVLAEDGVFRVEGLPPGRYRLEWRGPNGDVLAAREIELVDRYLQGIELRAGEGRGPRPREGEP